MAVNDCKEIKYGNRNHCIVFIYQYIHRSAAQLQRWTFSIHHGQTTNSVHKMTLIKAEINAPCPCGVTYFKQKRMAYYPLFSRDMKRSH